MKKLFTAIFILLCSVVFGQNGTPLYPITQNIGSTSALLDIKGGARVGGAFVLGHYADTTAANAVPYVKNFANGLITTDTNLLWIRSYNAQQWYFVPNTGNPATGDTLYWRVGGNALIPMQQQGIYTGLGSKDSTPLFFITNYQRRLVIPPNGVNRSAGTANKCLVIDTVTKFMYYTDCGSGGGTTYTFTNGLTESAGTVKLGGTLADATTTIDGGDAATLSFVDLSQLDINGRYSSFVFDSININSNNIKIDTLNYTLSTTGKKIMLRDTATGLVQNIDPDLLIKLAGATLQQDTITLASFGGGARFQSDTAVFTDSTLYGAFYNDGSDSLIVTKIWAVMGGGTSDTLGVQLYYNDSLNVIGSAIATSTLPVNSTTVGNSTSTLTNQKIPPGNWVWCKSPTVIAGRKPYFLTVSMIGYKSRRL